MRSQGNFPCSRNERDRDSQWECTQDAHVRPNTTGQKQRGHGKTRDRHPLCCRRKTPSLQKEQLGQTNQDQHKQQRHCAIGNLAGDYLSAQSRAPQIRCEMEGVFPGRRHQPLVRRHRSICDQGGDNDQCPPEQCGLDSREHCPRPPLREGNADRRASRDRCDRGSFCCGGVFAHRAASASRARSAVCEGVRPTFTPTASSAFAFAEAVPELPDTIAPAWPMVLPSGAVKPAM